ncbi:MAG: hypothetical protein R2941_11365 [Desulfobacterales bacterium]
MGEFIRLFGKKRIEAVCAGREFIGSERSGRLRKEEIPVHIRIKNNLYVSDSRGHGRQVSRLFRDLKNGQSRALRGKRKCGNVMIRLSGLGLPGGELLIAACPDRPGNALEVCAKSRQTETVSACLKSRGFRFESAHLKDPERISRLPAVVRIASAWGCLIPIPH